MKSPQVPLGEVVDVRNGYAFRSTDFKAFGIPVIRMSDLEENEVSVKTAVRVDPAFLKQCKDFQIVKGDLLIGMSGSVGKIAVYSSNEPALQNQRVGLFQITNKSAIDYDYLRFFSYTLEEKLLNRSKGVAVKNVSTDDIKSIPLPLPNLSQQKTTASTIRCIDRLRRLRRYALELSDSFLQSVFVEMFGDPVSNPKKWSMELFEDVGILDRGRSKHRPRDAAHLYGGKYPFIQTGDVANCDDYIIEHKQTYSEAGLKQSKLWDAGVLCITIAANIAKTGILTYPACFPDSIVGFIPSNAVRTEYVQYWLKFLQQILERTAPESAQKNINLEILRELKIPVPPLSVQDKFVTVVKAHKKNRIVQKESQRQAEHLFQTLLHQAFSEN